MAADEDTVGIADDASVADNFSVVSVDVFVAVADDVTAAAAVLCVGSAPVAAGVVHA